MTNRHSDGPWHIDTHPYDDSNYGLFDDCGTQLGSVERWDGDGEEDVMAVATANARLIAAAPELLAAVKEYCEAAERGDSVMDCSSLMFSALKKATGEDK